MKRILAALAAVVAATAPGFAQSVTVRTLQGGATLITLQEPDAQTVVIEACFRVGVADENGANESGLAAILTRTWAGGGAIRTARQIGRDIGQFGTLGVYQSGDYVELWTVSAFEGRDIAAQTLFQNVIAAPGFSAPSLAQAKRSIRRERLLREDGLLTDALHRLRARVFALSPAGRDPLGDTQNVGDITAPALQRFYDRTVGRDASRAVFVVAGNIGADDAETLVRSGLAAGDWSAWKTQAKPAPPQTFAPDVVPPGLKPLDLRRAAPSRLLLVGYAAPGTTEADAATLAVLDAVMGAGKNCRLFPLRDAADVPIGYDISTRLEAGREQSLWVVQVSGATGATNGTAERITAECRAAGDGSRPITDAELSRAKALLIAKHRRERQRLTDRASALAVAQVMGLGATFETDYEAKIGAVTLGSVQAFAGLIFGANAATVATGSP